MSSQTERKRQITQKNKIRSESGHTTTDASEIKKKNIRDYYEH